MQTKVASILDLPKPRLSPDVWDENNALKPEVKKFIFDFISSFAQANNFKHLNEWITDIRFIGSLCTNTYNKQSDCDIHIMADLEKFSELEDVGVSGQKASDYLDDLRKQVDRVKVCLPNTEHPIEIYFENEFTTPTRMEWSGAYDLLADKWLHRPHIIGQDFDANAFYPDLIEAAKEVAEGLDASFGDVKREIKDIKQLEETIEAWSSENRGSFEKKLQKKLDDLEAQIKDLVSVRETVLDARHKSDTADSQAEITMKYLQKYFYINILTNLKELMKQSPDLTMKDIPVVDNIMSQAALSKKEAAYADMDSSEQATQVIMIDVDDTISRENPDGTMGAPIEDVKSVLEKLKSDGYYIVLDSHRANTEEGRQEVKEFMDQHSLPYDEIYEGQKPLAFRYIDDRAICFTSWDEVLKQVEKAESETNKAASLSSTAAQWPEAFYLSPTGKLYPVKRTHDEWVIANIDLLKREYNLDLFKAFGDKATIDASIDSIMDHLLVLGWTRGSIAANNRDYVAQVHNISSVPTVAIDFFLGGPDNLKLTIEDGSETSFVTVTKDDLLEGQKGINRAMRRSKTSALSKKEAAFNPYDDESLKQGPAYAVYIGTQKGVPELGMPDAKLYNIFGDHPRFGSTVTEDTLKELKIPIREQEKKAQLGSEYDYSSAQFNLPKELSEQIIRWAVENIPEGEIVHDSKDPGTKGIQLDSHITLKYGLLTDNFEEVEKALKGEKAPHAKLSKTSFFEPEGKDYDVVIIVVESEDLQSLNKKLCDNVEHKDTTGPEYHPHVTVAYVKKGQGKKYDGKDILTGEKLVLETLMFSPKKGEPRHLELKASFMPSNTDLAPSDDWAGTVGYPTNEAMDAPENKSDEETWYSPENDRPRDRQWWKKILNLFMPMSKKEVKKETEQTKKSFIPSEPRGDPNMDWNFSDYVNSYIDDNWQDFLVGWLELDPKNYVKPAIQIEKIYKDEGSIFATVRVDFINMAGQADAFIKLNLNANVHYEPSYEPEGVETHEIVDDWETEVLEYGKNDQSDKTSSYGPTNYKGPSSPDAPYQDSAWGFNTTYSPEENDENVKQNGADGYPQRWFGRPKGKYYTDEGEVVKMLEEVDKEAAVSGQLTNKIVNLIYNSGGATYNLQKGSLVGTPYYAVAIYPDREQIAERPVDFEDIEMYLDANEDLLNDPNNSLGAWTHGGKVYLDVVATVADKNEAMELGRKHNQLAIFDLQNMQEIPLSTEKQAAAVSDREQQKYYDEVYSDRWRDDSSKIDGGNEYYDWSELGSNDHPNPKDLDKERGLLDQLEKPVNRNFPGGLGEYQVTWYDAYPDQGDKAGM